MKNIQLTSSYGKPIFSSTVTVPESYVFEKHIDSFIKESGASVRVVGNIPTDTNFSQVSNKLSPGEKYQVAVVPIIQYIGHCQQCLNHLKMEKDLLFFGTQGLVLFKQQHPLQIPFGRLISFDEKESLYHNGSIEQLYYMQRDGSVSYTEFSNINFWSSLSSRGQYLLLFYKL